jgi:hypothetical protein
LLLLVLHVTRKTSASPWSLRLPVMCRRWKAGRQRSWRIASWKRSQAALWFGERAGIR